MIASTLWLVRSAGLILAVSLPLMSTQAQAYTVTVGGTTYELNESFGSYNNIPARFQSQPWWGSSSIATQFADALLDTDMPRGQEYYFAYSNSVGVVVAYRPTEDEEYFGDEVSRTYIRTRSPDDAFYFLTVPTSVPEINAGALSQALLILFALWLVTRRRAASHAA